MKKMKARDWILDLLVLTKKGVSYFLQENIIQAHSTENII